jgi:hypothetical protein
MSKKSNKKSTKSTTTQQRPAKRKKIVSLAQYEAEAAKERAAKGAAKTNDVPPQAETTGKAEPTARTRKERTPAGPRKSLANAAILVLAKAKEPMNAKAIVEAATTNGWYEPSTGKTPHATLYSAMLMDARKADARFRKAERGLWTLTDAGKSHADAIQEAFAQ